MFNHKGEVDDYITKVLDAPADDEYREFNNAFDENKNRATKVIAEREQKKREASNKRKDSRKANINKIMSESESLVDEAVRDAALKRSDCFARTSKDVCIRFANPFVDGLMRQYIVTPSKIRKKIIKDIADNINTKFRLIDEKRFLNLDFLSENDPFEAVLKRHYCNKYVDLESLLAIKDRYGLSRLADEDFFNLLEIDNLVDAIGI